MPVEDFGVVPVLKRSFKSLVEEPGFVGLYLLPSAVLAIASYHAWTFGTYQSVSVDEPLSLLTENFGFGWIILYAAAAVTLGLVAFAGIILKAKARENGKRIGFVRAVREGLTYAPKLLLVYIIGGIIVLGPFFAFLLLSVTVSGIIVVAIVWLLPMIYLGVRLSLAGQACVIEDLGPVESLKTCWRTTSGSFWIIFLTGLALSIISMAITIILRIIRPTIVQTVGSLITSAIIGPTLLIAYTIIYLKLSERKRGSGYL